MHTVAALGKLFGKLRELHKMNHNDMESKSAVNRRLETAINLRSNEIRSWQTTSRPWENLSRTLWRIKKYYEPLCISGPKMGEADLWKTVSHLRSPKFPKVMFRGRYESKLFDLVLVTVLCAGGLLSRKHRLQIIILSTSMYCFPLCTKAQREIQPTYRLRMV